jgi:CheY-like chemotaxis protein
MDPAQRRVLHVEDQEDHAFLIRRCFDRLDTPCLLVQVNDGEQALDYLRGPEPYPDLVLLDLRLPRMDGLTVLGEIKADSTLRHIPVVVRTTASAPGDLRGAAERHVNSYLVKPAELGGLRELIEQVEAYWLGIDRLGRLPPLRS